MFWVEGEIRITGARGKLMNSFVMQLLNRRGIRKVEEIMLGGRATKVVSIPCPDANGIIKFDYSIFERKERKEASYDMNTFMLEAPDCGYGEFGLVMNMILVLQILSSESTCHFMHEDEQCSIEPYRNLIFSLVELEDGTRLGDLDPRLAPYGRFLRDNDDEFLEFWEGDELDLTVQLTERIEGWRAEFRERNGDGLEITEERLAGLIHEMYEDWDCRLVDRRFVEDFLGHREDEDYRRAFRLLRSYMDKDLAYFPELTKEQAVEWVLKGNRDKYESIMLSALQSLLINRKKRQELFGF